MTTAHNAVTGSQGEAKYTIVRRRIWYGCRTTHEPIMAEDASGTAASFSRAEARAEIARRDSEIYHLAHNEAGRPHMSIRYWGRA